ncbi:M13 family metallopeptidase [Pseudactinotalea sp. HY158]|uniref:M13 family metallopeptidase n=1 Tax=Pseudactinotalea sp. HY158 TaxID=2654547 RepID=UPI00129C2956|nr:M13-type metalloendopeptidase [Pseudactinotalea sp. HY158]QGH70113.1 peptidase M13 [Pseudactinotalea sp. HY158]
MTTSAPLPALADLSTRPQDDLYRHVNGTWLRAHEIAADRARTGVARELFDRAELDVRAIITEAADVPASDPDHAAAQQIAATYGAFMNTAAIESAGIAPLEADLAPLRAVTNRAELARAVGTLERDGVGSTIGAFVNNDAGNPTEYRVYLTQAGIGLPDEAYYREDAHAEIRTAYVAHIARMLTLTGVVPAGESEEAAGRVMAVETALAAGHWDTVRDRDAQATYNRVSRSELVELAPGYEWSIWARALAGSDALLDELVVRQPSYLTTVDSVWGSTPLADLVLWQSWHVVHARAPFLTEAVVAENFDFYGRTLTGAQELRDRWKRGVSLTESLLGEAIGKLYVARHFPPANKGAMTELVADLTEAYRQSISALPWMGEQTREQALVKLGKFTPKIGYPNRWRDYSALEVAADDLLGNVRAASAFETDYELAKLGRPIDREEWLMTPQTVNAYYHPTMNEIVFPAAILQAPFFSIEADAASNYGGIGAVIGHEIGHGFDDQGSHYDGEGRLADWWTEADREEFTARTQALIDQFSALSPAQLEDSHRVNGEFTLGENIGDLGGLGIAVKAYRIARGKGVDAGLDEAEALRRLFASFAAVWRVKARDEEAIRLLAIDPHSPEEFRCNQTVKNLDEFHEVFATAPGDGMWLAPEQRVSIW